MFGRILIINFQVVIITHFKKIHIQNPLSKNIKFNEYVFMQSTTKTTQLYNTHNDINYIQKHKTKTH